MAKNWLAIFKPIDALILIIAITVMSASVAATWVNSEPAGRVSIEGSGVMFLYALSSHQEIEVEGPIGTTRLEIADGKVRVLSSPCRDQICVKAGWLENNGQWTACLPNRVFVSLESSDDSGIDVFSF